MSKTEEAPVSFLSALKIPGVAEYALSYFALKVWVEKFSKNYKNKPAITIFGQPVISLLTIHSSFGYLITCTILSNGVTPNRTRFRHFLTLVESSVGS